MPKLLLNVSDLRSLAGYAVRAVRHPVATGQGAVATARTIAGAFVSQPSRTVAPGAPERPGSTAPAPEPAAPPVTPEPVTPEPAAAEPAPAPAPDQAEIRRTGPAPHVAHASRLPRDVERDVEAELDEDEA